MPEIHNQQLIEYSEIKQAAERATSNQELLAVVNKADELYLADVPMLTMTDENWKEFTAIVRNRAHALDTLATITLVSPTL